MKNNKIYYLLATQHDNMGDLLINKMLIDELSNYGDVYTDAEGVDKFKSYLFERNIYPVHNIKKASLKRKSFYKLLIPLKSFDYLVGTAGPSGKIIGIKGFISQIYITAIYLYCKLIRVKVLQIGNDFSLTTNLEKKLVHFKNKIAKQTLVRSKSGMQEWYNTRLKNIDSIPDMAFLYDISLRTYTIFKKKILVSFRDLNEESYKNDIIDYLTDNLPVWIENNYTVEFFYQVDSDQEFNSFLYSLFNTHKEVSFRADCLWYDDIPYYEDAAVVISNRLHVLLLGLIHLALPLPIISGDSKLKKIRNIFTDIGLGELLDRENVQVCNVLDKYNVLRPKIEIVVNECKLEIKEKIANCFK